MSTIAEIRKLVPELEDRYVEALFGFPHILKSIDVFWGSRECVIYLESLLIDRRGNRQGFPSDVAFAIQKLIDAHNEQWPRFKTHTAPTPFTLG